MARRLNKNQISALLEIRESPAIFCSLLVARRYLSVFNLELSQLPLLSLGPHTVAVRMDVVLEIIAASLLQSGPILPEFEFQIDANGELPRGVRRRCKRRVRDLLLALSDYFEDACD